MLPSQKGEGNENSGRCWTVEVEAEQVAGRGGRSKGLELERAGQLLGFLKVRKMHCSGSE